MPSVSIAPARLTWTAQNVTFQPERLTLGPARITWAGGSLSFTGGNTALSASAPELNRLTRFEQLTDKDGTPTMRLMGIWQEAMDKIEEAFAALSTQVGDNTALLNQIQAAQALAQAANDNAAAVAATTSLANSYTDPVAVLSASSSGTVTIAAHDRVYGDGTRVSVDAGSVSGFASGAYVTIYYQDAGREGGAVLYKGSTSPIAQEGATHIVGQVTIPAAGEPTSTGSGTTAPGYTPPSGGGSFDTDYETP